MLSIIQQLMPDIVGLIEEKKLFFVTDVECFLSVGNCVQYLSVCHDLCHFCHDLGAHILL